MKVVNQEFPPFSPLKQRKQRQDVYIPALQNKISSLFVFSLRLLATAATALISPKSHSKNSTRFTFPSSRPPHSFAAISYFSRLRPIT